MIYPDDLAKLPPIESWVAIVVVEDMVAREDTLPNVISIITPPSNYAIAYQSMWAFGNHLRVPRAKQHLSTVDSKVATTFEQECCSCSND